MLSLSEPRINSREGALTINPNWRKYVSSSMETKIAPLTAFAD